MSSNTNPFEKDRQRRKLQKANKAVKRNREARAPRRKNWLDVLDDDLEALDGVQGFERIMPLDENDRRRRVVDVASDPDEARESEAPSAPDALQGRVLEVSTGLCRVALNGRSVLCDLRGSLSAADSGFTNVVTVGDRVLISRTASDSGVVEQVLPRRNTLTRPDPFYSHLQQLLAANVDQLLIIAAWRQPHLWPELIDRYLIAAERSAITPVICVNKIDLATDPETLDAAIRPYRELDHRVLLTSATAGRGLDDLRDQLRGKVSVLAGLSGVGKSSLLTAVQPDFQLRVGAVNEELGHGRHTTTQSNMLPFGPDGYVIDTPGIREFGLFGLTRAELIAYYPDLAAHAGRCRFSDCTHQHEPDCAVRAGVQAGTIDATRYHNYTKIWDSLPD